MINKLQIIEINSIRVLTTAQLSQEYNADRQQISKNFTRNSKRYIEGKHYISLTGKEKRDFLNRVQIDDGSKNASTLYLWTERGAWLHAKSLNTDEAWDSYEYLVDEYFRLQVALNEKSEQLNEITEKAREKKLSLDDINKIRFSVKKTIGTFENSNMEKIKTLINDFVDYVKTLDTETRISRCNSAVRGMQRLHDRLAKEDVTNIGDCYNLMQKILELKDFAHMVENRRNGGIKSNQTKKIKNLILTKEKEPVVEH